MLVPNKICKVCQVIKVNKKLLSRIYESSYFLPHSTDTLKDITRDYSPAFSYDSILTHVKKHQFIDSQDYKDKMLEHANKQAEQRAVRKAVKGQSAIQSVIDRGHERLENGEIDVNTAQLIRASEIQMKQEDKAKDRELATVEMIAFFLSGADQPKPGRSFIDAD